MATQIQLRRGNSTLWTSSNPTLAEGELGLELDTGKFKIGDGTTAWNSLGYSSGGDSPSGGGVKTQRLVIGTSTAGWTSSDCDYLCDGTADDVQINAAITALPASGGEIVILDGTYNITATIDVTKDNVSIIGNGNATILKRMYDSSTQEEGLITLTSRSGCKISNLQVDGNQSIYSAEMNVGIFLLDSSDNTITGNTCTNDVLGIILIESNNSTVTGNTCNNNSYAGILLVFSSNNAVTGNTCNDNSNNGIALELSNNNTVTGNTCNNNASGISLQESINNTITGNTCNNGSFVGIGLTSASDNTITGNTCYNDSQGISLYESNNNTVTGNTCNNSIYTGISLQELSNNTVTGNTCNNTSFSGAGAGIGLDSVNNSTVTGNTCNDNSNNGIALSSSNNITVTGNTCIRGTGLSTDYDASQHTIRIMGSGNSYNLIAMNNCMGKAVTNEGGTGNTLVNNKFDAT